MALTKAAVIFSYQTPILLHGSAVPINVYHKFGRRRVYSILPLSILHHPSPNFYRGSKSAKFGHVFDDTRLWAAVLSKRRKISEIQL